MNDRIPADVEFLWDEFHQTVNMTSTELRAWLLTDASGEDAFPADPDQPLLWRAAPLVQLRRQAGRLNGRQRVRGHTPGLEETAWSHCVRKTLARSPVTGCVGGLVRVAWAWSISPGRAGDGSR